MADPSDPRPWSERKAEWRKTYMKAYNEEKNTTKQKVNKTTYENRYRRTRFRVFDIDPKRPRLLAARHVAHMMGLLRREVLLFWEEGRLVSTRKQNGYPRFWAEDVFEFAKREGRWNDTLQEYSDWLDQIVEMKEKDPEKYLELCQRLSKARKALDEKRRGASALHHLGETPSEEETG